MAQFFFFSLLVITLLAGAFAYFAPSQKSINPLKFMMDNSGYSSEVANNTKKSQQFNISTTKGIIQVRQQINDLAQKQIELFNSIRDQQQILKGAGKGLSDVMMEAQQEEGKNNFDVLQLKALTSQMQNQQSFLVAHGNDLVVLNDQLTQNRQLMADQIDMGKINTEASLQMLKQQYMSLKQQASGFFNSGYQYNQQVHDQMNKIQNQLQDLADNNAIQQQNLKDRIQHMLDRQRENMDKLADIEQKDRDLISDIQEKLAESSELNNDARQRTQDLIDDEHQKQEDQQELGQQRVADQMQRLQDQQNR